MEQASILQKRNRDDTVDVDHNLQCTAKQIILDASDPNPYGPLSDDEEQEDEEAKMLEDEITEIDQQSIHHSCNEKPSDSPIVSPPPTTENMKHGNTSLQNAILAEPPIDASMSKTTKASDDVTPKDPDTKLNTHEKDENEKSHSTTIDTQQYHYTITKPTTDQLSEHKSTTSHHSSSKNDDEKDQVMGKPDSEDEELDDSNEEDKKLAATENEAPQIIPAMSNLQSKVWSVTAYIKTNKKFPSISTMSDPIRQIIDAFRLIDTTASLMPIVSEAKRLPHVQSVHNENNEEIAKLDKYFLLYDEPIDPRNPKTTIKLQFTAALAFHDIMRSQEVKKSLSEFFFINLIYNPLEGIKLIQIGYCFNLLPRHDGVNMVHDRISKLVNNSNIHFAVTPENIRASAPATTTTKAIQVYSRVYTVYADKEHARNVSIALDSKLVNTNQFLWIPADSWTQSMKSSAKCDILQDHRQLCNDYQSLLLRDVKNSSKKLTTPEGNQTTVIEFLSTIKNVDEEIMFPRIIGENLNTLEMYTLRRNGASTIQWLRFVHHHIQEAFGKDNFHKIFTKSSQQIQTDCNNAQSSTTKLESENNSQVPRIVSIPKNVLAHLQKLEAKKPPIDQDKNSPSQNTTKSPNTWFDGRSVAGAGRGRGRGGGRRTPSRPFKTTTNNNKDSTITISTTGSTLDDLEARIHQLENDQSKVANNTILYTKSRFQRVENLANRDRSFFITQQNVTQREIQAIKHAALDAFAAIEQNQATTSTAIHEQSQNLQRTRYELNQRLEEHRQNLTELNISTRLPPVDFSEPILPEAIKVEWLNKTLESANTKYSGTFCTSAADHSVTSADREEGLQAARFMQLANSTVTLPHYIKTKGQGEDAFDPDDTTSEEDSDDMSATNIDSTSINNESNQPSDKPNNSAGPREPMEEGDGSAIT